MSATLPSLFACACPSFVRIDCGKIVCHVLVLARFWHGRFAKIRKIDVFKSPRSRPAVLYVPMSQQGLQDPGSGSSLGQISPNTASCLRMLQMFKFQTEIVALCFATQSGSVLRT